jgi:histidinol dehydrogenase
MTAVDTRSVIVTAPWLRYTGSIDELPFDARRALFARVSESAAVVSAETARIVSDIRARGDSALFDMARRFDSVELAALEVPRDVMMRALDETPVPLRRAMERAARNIATVHRAFMPAVVEVESEPGVIVGRRPDPLRRIGVYAPGGRASYPSSVLMGAIPARVAGVGEIVLCSPPDRSGFPTSAVLAAAALAGVDRAFAVGGAGAIAAMALGTASIPRVDRIVGPGNAYVAAAKLQLVGEVAIDSPAGPSELLIVADDSVAPREIALEMVAQAEHDPNACVLALAVGAGVADAISLALAHTAAATRPRDVVARALAGQGGVLRARSVDSAIDFANEYAPEHLLLAIRNPDDALPRVRNAGTVFLGATSSVTFGDYMTGANHVLPTGSAARAYSGLSPLDFVRWTTYQRVDEGAARRLADDVARFADAESLSGHAAAARRWSAEP